MNDNAMNGKINEISCRIKEMREILGFTVEQMAAKTDTEVNEYIEYESGKVDFPFTFIHKCAVAFGIELTELLEGSSAHLSTYTVTRKGEGHITTDEDGIRIQNLAPMFRGKLAEPYWVNYEYSADLQNKPIHLTTHSGQEFDLVISGRLKIQVGEHTEILGEGDSIFYNSSTPHGMIAVDGKDCLFCAVVMSGSDVPEAQTAKTIAAARSSVPFISEKFVDEQTDDNGALTSISFKNVDNFNFAFDIVDELGRTKPDKLAMLHLDRDKNERRFTFGDMKRGSSQCANYFKSLGIKRGDRVMISLKRHYQFWFSILALHKLGAIAIPATNLLKEHDIVYRLKSANVNAVLCTADGDIADQVELAQKACGISLIKVIAGGKKDGWHCFDEEYTLFSGRFPRPEGADCPGGDDLALMFFTSGTTGFPKIAAHSYKYPLGHYITAKYWQKVNPNGLHFTISDTGWGKALWGKLYGQWLCESAVFTYDFDRFDAADILGLFAKYKITTFCAPPTMYRMFIKENLEKYDLSSLENTCIAGEALNPEVFKQFHNATGLEIMEGFGQSETTLFIANLAGAPHRVGSMGRPVTSYDVDLLLPDGTPAGVGENGEIVVRTGNGAPLGLFEGYYSEGNINPARPDDIYHTGDIAWRDEDGFYWFVGRVDDVIKSSGYRIGPFEIENVIMELPYVLECGVTGVPDEIRGQVVKASIVLTKGTPPTEELKKEIQQYVKNCTAPYKYPRIVEFRDELPKTVSGKIQRNKL